MALSVKAKALWYLKNRPHSQQEIREKLKLKGYDLLEIEGVIQELLKANLLNDRVFAQAWFRYRLARPFGFLRITRELRHKGVADDVITSVLLEFQALAQETQTIDELVVRRAARMQGIPLEKKRKRVLDFLLRRGFKADDAIKAIRKLD